MNKSIYRPLILILFVASSLGWETNFLEAAEKSSQKKSHALLAQNNAPKKDTSSEWDLDAFIVQNFTIFKENLPLKRAEKIIEFLGKNGLNPQISIAPEFEGEKRVEGAERTYDILIPLSEQAALENLLVMEMEKRKEEEKKIAFDITPSARGCCQKRHGFVLYADFLYWKVTEDNIFYGARIPYGTVNSEATEKTGTVKYNLIQQPFEWDPGVRVGVGYNLPYYGWDLDLNWTYIQSKPKFFMSEPNGGILIYPIGMEGFSPNIANTLQANWHLVFNSMDLSMGRSLFLSRKLSIRPSGGLKTAWIHQKFGYAIVSPPPPSILNRFTPFARIGGPVHASNDFWGIGPRFGFDGRYVLPLNFGLFFQTAAALLYGKFDIDINYQYTRGAVANGIIVSSVTYNKTMRDTKHRLCPWLQLQIGLDWSLCFGKNRNISFSAGYECQFFWEQMRVEYFQPNGDPRGNLMMNGLTLQGKLEF